MSQRKVWGLEKIYQREILRLYYKMGRKRQHIADALGISFASVQREIEIAEENGGARLLDLSESELASVLYPIRPGRKAMDTKAQPDCEYLVSELKKKGVTKSLLYREYVNENPGNAYGYSMFCQKISDYISASALTMVLDHKPGEEAFLDYCGDTVAIYDSGTSQVSFEAEIFLDTLAYSGYSYFEAQRRQDSQSFTGGIARGFTYFNGVVKTLVPDNLKAGVITNSKSDLRLSRAMMELAEHYQVFVDPARKYRAKDKAKVEERVGYVQRNVLAALRVRKFYSISELNRALGLMLDEVNSRPFTKKPGSRKELFEKEREFLSPLPLLAFNWGTWKSALVPSNYHIDIEGCKYSVPSGYRNKRVEIKLAENTVEIFFDGASIATHERCMIPGSVVTKDPHLHPKHRGYLDSQDVNILLSKASSIGPNTLIVARAVYSAAAIGETGIKSLKRLLSLAELQGPEILESACRHGVSIGATSRHSISAIVRTKAYENPPREEPPSFPHHNLRYFQKSRLGGDHVK